MIRKLYSFCFDRQQNSEMTETCKHEDSTNAAHDVLWASNKSHSWVYGILKIDIKVQHHYNGT